MGDNMELKDKIKPKKLDDIIHNESLYTCLFEQLKSAAIYCKIIRDNGNDFKIIGFHIIKTNIQFKRRFNGTLQEDTDVLIKDFDFFKVNTILTNIIQKVVTQKIKDSINTICVSSNGKWLNLDIFSPDDDYIIAFIDNIDVNEEMHLHRCKVQYGYKSTIIGLAECQILFDENRKFVDYKFLKANKMFEELIGYTNIDGKLASFIFKNTKETVTLFLNTIYFILNNDQATPFKFFIEKTQKLIQASIFRSTNDEFHIQIVDVTDKVDTTKALEKLERQFSDLFTSMPFGYLKIQVVREKSGEIIDARSILSNPYFEKYIVKEKTAEESYKEYFNEDPEMFNFIMDILKNVISTHKSCKQEIFWKQTGNFFNTTFFFSDSDIVTVQLEDITKIKETELLLKKTEKKYSDIFDEMSFGCCTYKLVYDKNDRISDAIILKHNLVFQKMCWLDNLVGRSINDAFNFMPEKIPIILSHLQKIDKTKVIQIVDFYCDPMHLWFHVMTSPIEEGVVFSAIYDITTQKTIELSLSKTQTKYEQLFDTMPYGLVSLKAIFDLNGNIVNFRVINSNEAYEIGTGFKDSKEKTISELYSSFESRYSDRFHKYKSILLKGGTATFDTFSTVSKKWLHFFAFSSEKNVVSILVEDVTIRKKNDLLYIKKNSEYLDLFENNSDGIAKFVPIIDKNGYIIDATLEITNEAFDNFVEVTLPKNTSFRMILKDKSEILFDLISLFNRVYKTKHMISYEIYIPIIEKWAHIKTYLSNNRDIFILIENISMRKKVELNLLEKEKHIYQIFEHFQHGIILFQAKYTKDEICDFDIIYNNPKFTELFGEERSSKDTLNNFYEDVPIESEKRRKVFIKLLNSIYPSNKKYTSVVTGKKLYYSAFSPIKDEILVMISDVTNTKESDDFKNF